MSCTLNTNGARRARAIAQPAGPSVSGGDMASTTSGRSRSARASAPARPVKPPNANARAGTLVLSVGKGWTRVMRPTAAFSGVRAGRPSPVRPVVPVPGQGGDQVQAVAKVGQGHGDRRHDLASGGHVGCVVGAEDGDVHRHVVPRARSAGCCRGGRQIGGVERIRGSGRREPSCLGPARPSPCGGHRGARRLGEVGQGGGPCRDVVRG